MQLGTTERWQGYWDGYALVAEAIALKAALSDPVSFGLTDVICFSDSKSLIDLLTGRKYVIALQGLFHDLGVLSNSFTSISFKFIPRVFNDEADRLAKNALFLASNNPCGFENSVLQVYESKV